MVDPHGGVLQERLVSQQAFDEKARGLARVRVDARVVNDLELFAVGALSPLTGFLDEEAWSSVVERLRLPDGTVWPLPVTLALEHPPRPGEAVVLTDEAGRERAIVTITSRFEREPLHEAQQVYGTQDHAHPGVAALLSAPRTLVGGPVEVAPLPPGPFEAFRLTPRALRDELAHRGWTTVAGFQTRNPIHRAHEALTKVALEVCDGLVLHPLVGETKKDDVPAAARFESYQALVRGYYPPSRTVLAAFPAAMRYAGPREALFHVLVRKNYGITHLIIGRDHAGVGSYYPPLAAQQLVKRFTFAELGVTPLTFDPTFYCRACGAVASERTCPHPSSAHLALSGTQLRELLQTGRPIPPEVTRPEIAAILRKHVNAPPAPQRGVLLWFTGLSGAGKSTLAKMVEAALKTHHRVEVLDGDEIRATLSKGLGFSREDRDTNIRRIGMVGRLLARNGVVAIGAAISPYAATRDEVRAAAAADGVAFVEVHLHAPMEALLARDEKGLYRRALAGELAHFTGVSDPYEAPVSPELSLDTARDDAATCARRILEVLARFGVVP
ncbi:MAG: sulfate adenylyltransferase [Myxococcaceae bacterium]|nr:sulfate adenylyltransferase [Myxococcaceae bacterium]